MARLSRGLKASCPLSNRRSQSEQRRPHPHKLEVGTGISQRLQLSRGRGSEIGTPREPTSEGDDLPRDVGHASNGAAPW